MSDMSDAGGRLGHVSQPTAATTAAAETLSSLGKRLRFTPVPSLLVSPAASSAPVRDLGLASSGGAGRSGGSTPWAKASSVAAETASGRPAAGPREAAQSPAFAAALSVAAQDEAELDALARFQERYRQRRQAISDAHAGLQGADAELAAAAQSLRAAAAELERAQTAQAAAAGRLERAQAARSEAQQRVALAEAMPAVSADMGAA